MNLEKQYFDKFMYAMHIDCDFSIERYFRKYEDYAYNYSDQSKTPDNWVDVHVLYHKWKADKIKKKNKLKRFGKMIENTFKDVTKGLNTALDDVNAVEGEGK